MSTSHKDSERDQLHDQLLNKLVAEFPAVHQPSDCIAATRRIGGLFARIYFPERDWSALEADTGNRESPPAAGTYTVQDANDIAAKLRTLAAIEESKVSLNSEEIVRRLVPEIRALRERGFTLARIAETLGGFGVAVTEALLESCLDWRWEFQGI